MTSVKEVEGEIHKKDEDSTGSRKNTHGHKSWAIEGNTDKRR
jgi:hypothetical protein